MHDLEPLRVAFLAEGLGAYPELERAFLAQPDVQFVRHTAPDMLLDGLRDLEQPAPNLIVMDASDDLAALQAVRGLERGATLPVVLVGRGWTAARLERAAALRANSCVAWPHDASARRALCQDLTVYWCQTNEPHPV